MAESQLPMYKKNNSQCIPVVYTADVPTMSDSDNQFGEWLRKWRKDADLSQEELGERVGVTKQHISNLERGEVSTYTGESIRPSFDLTLKLAKALGRPVKEACDLAGYELPANSQQEPPDTVEEALKNSFFFDQAGLSERAIENLRPLLRVVDREVERLKEAPEVIEEPKRVPTKTGSMSPLKPKRRRVIEEAIDNALGSKGEPLSEKDRATVRKVLQEDEAPEE